jgi:serine/threonine protein phosphatase PrpC
MAMIPCPSCAAPAADEDRFCGECGLPLTAPEPAESACICGAPASALDAEGYCSECGRKTRVADPHDHAELSLSPDFALVTDRGLKHAKNEDAVLIAEHRRPEGVYRLLVVSDGVSTSFLPEQASAVAVEAFRDAAFAALDRAEPAEKAVAAGCAAAQDAVSAIPFPPDVNSPAATIVAALVIAGRAALAWAGDSRAYLLAETPKLLTRDDSWLNQVVDSGQMSEDEARLDRHAHAIVSCLHPLDADEDFTPHIETLDLPLGSTFLLCSDGFWNYAETPDAVASIAAKSQAGADAATICRDMVAFANSQGGRDNISVAMLKIAPASSDARMTD